MIPNDQKILHNPDGIPGDCLRACVSSILNLNYQLVPHFALFGDAWEKALKLWAKHNNYQCTITPHAGALSNRNLYFIAVGKGPRQLMHCCVVKRTESGTPVVEHDPHPSRDGLLRMDYFISCYRPTISSL